MKEKNIFSLSQPFLQQLSSAAAKSQVPAVKRAKGLRVGSWVFVGVFVCGYGLVLDAA